MAVSAAAVLPLPNMGIGCIAKPSPGQASSPAPPTVRLPTHTSPSYEQVVQGRTSSLTPAIEEFRGIPYGSVPARWEHSLLRRSLPQDVFDASRHGPKCPQPAAPNNSSIYQCHLAFPDVGESETECLNLFIVRPSPAAILQAGYDPIHAKLPVYFYIHGGAFGFGASTDPIWDPTRLILHSLSLRKPFIAVLINYRLNLFGFAASSSIIEAQQKSPQLKGCNFGIHDQKIALRWVLQNISSFGGDPRDITLGGQSAGGCSVHTHILEARSRAEPPLFRRAIIQSGAFTSVGIGPVPLEDCDRRWDALCDYFGIADQPDMQRMEMLRRMPAEDLIRAGDDLGWKVFFLASDNLTITALSETEWSVDFDQNEGGEAIRESGDAEPIKILIGDTEAEGSVFIANALPKIQSYQQIQGLFQKAYSSDGEADTILQAYGIQPGVSVLVLHQSLIDFITDVTFGYSVHSTHRELSMMYSHQNGTRSINGAPQNSINNPTTAQLYRVKFGNPFPGPNHDVAHHCVDLIYLFDAFHDDLAALDQQDEGSVAGVSNSALRQEMQSAWVDFIVVDGKDIKEDSALVYGKDRIGQVESLRDDREWVERRRKLDLIGRHRREAATVMERLFSLALS